MEGAASPKVPELDKDGGVGGKKNRDPVYHQAP
jgi:hypothetical protein